MICCQKKDMQRTHRDVALDTVVDSKDSKIIDLSLTITVHAVQAQEM